MRNKMYYYQEKINMQVGEACRKAREKKGLTITGLYTRIQNWHFSYLIRVGHLSEADIQIWIKEGTIAVLNKEQQKRLRALGIKDIAPTFTEATISKYENGSMRIPYYYVYIVKQICGDFDIIIKM